MTQYVDSDGRVSNSASATFRYGPYLRQGMPPLKSGPNAGKAAVKVVTGSGTLASSHGDDVGWIYNDTTGEIVANVPQGAQAEQLEGTSDALSTPG